MFVDCLIMLLYLCIEFINTKQLKMKTLGKIRLIEEPKSEDLLRNELEEALGGWNCTSYDDGWWNEGSVVYHFYPLEMVPNAALTAVIGSFVLFPVIAYIREKRNLYYSKSA